MIGVSAEEYLRSATLIEQGLTKALELYRPDGMPIAFDLQLEAEVLGCELRWATETPPAVVSHPLTQRGIDDLPHFDASQGRFPIVLDALHAMKARVGDEIGLYGLITGPFTLALHLLGNEVFLKLRRDPEFASRVLEYCAGVGKLAAEAYLDNGADIIAVVDPMTSQISPKHFVEFVDPHVNAVFDHVRQKGGLSSMFVCGDATRNLECMCRTHCDNISIDENVPLELAKELGEKYNRSFGGNLKLTSALLLGNEDDAKLEALRCMEIGGTNGFVLAPGCDLPYATPEENLKAVALMVHDEYQRHVANTTLHARAAMHVAEVELPDYAGQPRVFIDVVTLDSASCAPCQYMMTAAEDAARQFGEQVVVTEHKISTREGLAFMLKLGVQNVPTICIDGQPRYISIIPDADTLVATIADAVARKNA
ncbi:MAG: uroporphyrinogen decarboxylase, partial [Phycisphaerae bacterium]|nr:uroporphyrinogen decarboxylase [Phycisphaerae bacterium]